MSKEIKNVTEEVAVEEIEVTEQEAVEVTESKAKKVWNKVKKPLIGVGLVAGGLVAGLMLGKGSSYDEGSYEEDFDVEVEVTEE